MYKCKYFKINELVHPNILKEMPENILWMMFDDRLLKSIDMLRKYLGLITVNGNGLVDCGLREMNSSTGAKYSAHKMGRAFDLHIKSIEDKGLNKEDKIEEYNKVRKVIIKNPLEIMHIVEKDFPDIFITNLLKSLNFENNISWLHIDTYNRSANLFNP